MHKPALLVLIGVLTPQIAAADVVRHDSIPQAYWGTWAPGSGPCQDANESTITLSAKEYVGPAENCSVSSVSETPGPRGPTYSARLQCSRPEAQAPNKTIVDVIIRPDDANRISVGPAFDSLKTYQRCSTTGQATKQ
jgi:hypothetical protein